MCIIIFTIPILILSWETGKNYRRISWSWLFYDWFLQIFVNVLIHSYHLLAPQIWMTIWPLEITAFSKHKNLLQTKINKRLWYRFQSRYVLVAQLCLFATPWTVAYRAPLSMEFSRQEYWSGLPFPSPEDLPDPGIGTQVSCFAGRFFIVWTTRAAHRLQKTNLKVMMTVLLQ